MGVVEETYGGDKHGAKVVGSAWAGSDDGGSWGAHRHGHGYGHTCKWWAHNGMGLNFQCIFVL